jgi:predicted TIM-barrel fold metal-dependent hydrolase
MERQVETGLVTSFKVYTAWGPGGRGYALDDPAIGLPVIDKARELGVDVICAHKGLPIQGFDYDNNDPRDVVAVAKQYPDIRFVVYHSAFERETTEGPYDPNRARTGTNALLKAMDDYGMPANSNVYCELGTTWREVLSNPTEAAHVLGKLLTRMGENRVLWGTDAIWYGSPQPQIMAFRAFEISPQFQEQFGYPALTPAIKTKIFGSSAAELFGIDTSALYCGVDARKLDEAKAAYASLIDEGTVTEPWQARGPLTRREVLAWLRQPGARLGP